MTEDFRIKTDFFEHPKTQKLQRKLGAEGVLALLRLFAFVAINKPTGVLANMDNDDIAIAGKYDGDSDRFVEALLSVRYFEKSESGDNEIHDWAEHNPWAFGAPARSKKASKAADARWEGKEQNGSRTDSTSDPKPETPANRPPQRANKQSNHAKSENEQCSNAQVAMQNDARSNAPNPTLPNLTYPSPNPTTTLPGVQGGDTASESSAGDGKPGGQAGGFSPIGDVGKVLPSLPDLSDAEKLSPEELYTRFQASVQWQTWGEHLTSVVASAKTPVRNKAIYLKPVILRILAGHEPLPGEVQAEAEERSGERGKAAQTRTVKAEPPKAPLPADWLPGVPEKQVRGLANQAFHRLKLAGFSDVTPLSERVRDEVRVLWRQLSGDGPMPWESVQEAVPAPSSPEGDTLPVPAIPRPVSGESAEIRSAIIEAIGLMPEGPKPDYSAQNISPA